MSLLIRGARVVPGDGSAPLQNHDVRIEGARIVALGERLTTLPGEPQVEALGRVLLPGFVDAHTHASWAGDRLDEFELRQQGASYLDILRAGGGILATVRAVRAASQDELAESLRHRLRVMRREGTTSVEVKSGYGLSTEHELKMLRAIRDATSEFPNSIVATALLGHAHDPDEPHFVDRVVTETLEAVHAEFPGITVDAYCEAGAWSVAECRRLFERARALGHPLRIHADQFQSLGGLELALEYGARSIDHLEQSSAAGLQRLATSESYGVLLPASSFHLDSPYANGRALLNAGGKLVLASNCNPGSSPTTSMPFVIALAVRKLGLSVLEAITATTSAPADLLQWPDRGRIRPGARADLILLRHHDERQLGYELGGNPVDTVISGGKVVAATTQGS